MLSASARRSNAASEAKMAAALKSTLARSYVSDGSEIGASGVRLYGGGNGSEYVNCCPMSAGNLVAANASCAWYLVVSSRIVCKLKVATCAAADSAHSLHQAARDLGVRLALGLDPLLAHADERADIALECLGVRVAEVRRDVVEEVLGELGQRRRLLAGYGQEVCCLWTPVSPVSFCLIGTSVAAHHL